MAWSVRLVDVLRVFIQPILLVFVVLFPSLPAWGQSSGRTVIDFQVKDGRLLVEITLNAEAMLAGVDPVDVSQGIGGGNAQYAQFRRLVSSELEPLVHDYIKDWKQTLRIEANGPVPLSYEGARIPVVGDPDLPRLSKVLLAGPVPDDAGDLRLVWPMAAGPVVLRQQGVEAPYTGYLNGGEASPRIPLRGGAGLGAQQTAEAFFKAGVLHVVKDGTRPAALVLTLVFLTLGVRSLMLQLFALAFGVLAALPLGLFQVIPSISHPAWPVLPAAIAVLAVWNLAASRLGAVRLIAVFVTGLILGLTQSEALSKLGVPPHHVAPALLGYGAGGLLALTCIAGIAQAGMTLFLPASQRLRGRISTVASLLLAGVGLYWTVLPIIPT